MSGKGSLSTPPRHPVEPPARRHRRLERWIDLLEDLVRIPGTRLSFGLDVLLGLLPVAGDLAGLLCGLPLVVIAVKRRLPFTVVLVMLVNLLVDAVVGAVPLAGNLFDLLWKAHRKNLVLLRRPEELGAVLREARWKAAALVAAVVLLSAALVSMLLFALWGLWSLWSRLGGF